MFYVTGRAVIEHNKQIKNVISADVGISCIRRISQYLSSVRDVIFLSYLQMFISFFFQRISSPVYFFPLLYPRVLVYRENYGP